MCPGHNIKETHALGVVGVDVGGGVCVALRVRSMYILGPMYLFLPLPRPGPDLQGKKWLIPNGAVVDWLARCPHCEDAVNYLGILLFESERFRSVRGLEILSF